VWRYDARGDGRDASSPRGGGRGAVGTRQARADDGDGDDDDGDDDDDGGGGVACDFDGAATSIGTDDDWETTPPISRWCAGVQ
jgi:hypothetical protein